MNVGGQASDSVPIAVGRRHVQCQQVTKSSDRHVDLRPALPFGSIIRRSCSAFRRAAIYNGRPWFLQRPAAKRRMARNPAPRPRNIVLPASGGPADGPRTGWMVVRHRAPRNAMADCIAQSDEQLSPRIFSPRRTFPSKSGDDYKRHSSSITSEG